MLQMAEVVNFDCKFNKVESVQMKKKTHNDEGCSAYYS